MMHNETLDDSRNKTAPVQQQPEAPGRQKSLKQRLMSGAIWTLIGRIFSVGSFFLANVILANSLGSEQFAAYLIVSSLVPFLAQIILLGTPHTMMRMIRIGEDSLRIERAKQSIAVTLRIVVLSILLLLPIYWLGTLFLGTDPKWQALTDYPALVAVWFVVSAICFVAAYSLQGLDDFRSAALIGARRGGMIPNLCFLIAIAIGSRFDLLDLRGVVVLQIVFHGVALLYAGLVMLKTIGQVPQRETAASQLTAKSEAPAYSVIWFAGESWPNLVTQLLTRAIVELDVLWVGIFATAVEIEQYGIARSLVLLVSAPLLMAAVSIGPFIAELYGKQEMQRLERLLRGSATLVGIPSILALLFFMILPEAIISLTYGPEFTGAATVLRILSVGYLVFVLSGCNGLTMTMTGRQRKLFACSLVTSLLYLAIAPFAIMEWGILGAAYVNSIIFAIQNIIVTLLVKLDLKIWTVASISPKDVKRGLQVLLRNNRKKAANQAIEVR